MVLEEGMTQAEVANRLSLSPKTIFNWVQAIKSGKILNSVSYVVAMAIPPP